MEKKDCLHEESDDQIIELKLSEQAQKSFDKLIAKMDEMDRREQLLKNAESVTSTEEHEFHEDLPFDL